MGGLVQFVTPLHQATSRAYIDRMVDNKVHCMLKAKEYEVDYWDGDRRYGYGGYKFIPGRWKPVAEALIQHFSLNSNSSVLDVGCGKGFLLYEMKQLLPDLQIAGFDISKHGLSQSREEIRDNLFHHRAQDTYLYENNSFDLVICQGVLHHTSDPYLGFKSIEKLVKPGGYIIIGLYNWYGRLITDFRRMIFNITGDMFKILDPRLKIKDRGMVKRDSWFNDQYKHPHESKHTISEVLHWFDKNNYNFINGVPKVKPFSPILINEKIFQPNPRGNTMHHLFSQIGTIISGYREGGLFIMIGEKNV